VTTTTVAFAPSVDRPARLDPRMTFDSFVPGSSNRLAFAAAQSVAETPGRAYNPLMIYGNSGLGKTHLLHAIGNYVQENYPGRKVLYVSTETFLNDFIRAIQTRTQLALHERYRENDVLLIDDIQFMETRGETFHEEIFHTYNALHGEGKQIVLTSDRSPRDLAGLQERFRSRLLQGLVTEIDSRTSRRALPSFDRSLSARASISRTTWLSGSRIASVTTSVSWRIHHDASRLRQPSPRADLARARQAHSPTWAKNRSSSNLKQSSRWWPTFTASQWRTFAAPTSTTLVHARHIAMYLIRDLLNNYSYPMIARIFDGRNHTTVISGVEKSKSRSRLILKCSLR